MYLTNNTVNTYASATANGSFKNTSATNALTIHGLISKCFAIPAHTPDIFACCGSLKNRALLSVVFILRILSEEILDYQISVTIGLVASYDQGVYGAIFKFVELSLLC